MICVYAGTDEQRAGHGLGVLQPEECSVQEETGGSYEASLTLTRKRDWELIKRGGVIRLPGAPHRLCAQEQLFRIYAYSVSEDGLRMMVQARHLSYDGMNCFIRRVDADGMALSALVEAMAGDTLGGPGLTYDLQAEGSYTGTLELVNAVNALLAPENGIVAQCRLRLERDNCAMRLRPLGGVESGLTLRWGRNVTSLPLGDSMDQVVTRLCPVGEDADGNQLMLPEKYIDSPRLGDFPTPLYSIWAVSGAKVGQKKTDSSGSTITLTEDDVYTLLRKAAQERLDSGCDLAKEETSAVLVDLRRAAGLERLELCLYDYLRLVHERAGLDRRVQLTGYTWDVLAGRYTKLELGQPLADRTAHALVTQPQMREKINRQSVKALNLIDVQANSIRLLAYDHEELAKRTSEAEIKLNGQEASINLIATDVQNQGDRISQAEIDIDGANAAIELRAKRTELTEAKKRISAAEVAIDGANAAIKLKADQSVVDDQGQRLSAAEVAIDGANAAIKLKADQSTVTEYGQRLSQAEIDIDGAEAAIKLKADQSTVTEYGERLSQAEIDIDGAEAAIKLKASTEDLDEMGNKVSDLETTFTVAADGIRANIADGDKTIGELKKTVDGLEDWTTDADGNISELTNTVRGTESKVTETNGKINELSNTAEGMRSMTVDQNEQITALVETANGIKEETHAIVTSAIWRDESHIRACIGKMYVDDNGKLHIVDGSGLMVDKGSTSVGVYDEDSLTAGLLVEKLNNGTTSAKIKADIINLDGYVTMGKMEAEFATLLDGFALEFSTTDLYASTITLGQSLSAPEGVLSANTIAASASMTLDGAEVATQSWADSRYFTRTYCNANYATFTHLSTNYALKSALSDYQLASGLTTKTVTVVTGVNASTATTPPFYNASGTQVSSGLTYVKSVSKTTEDITFVVYA